MRKFAIAAASAALLALPAFALAASPMTDMSSQGVVEIGPGGVRVGEPRVRRGPDCRELRAACLNKEQLGEQGEGNCRRYRRLCR